MKKIYIITGAAGFLGNNIVRKLQKEKDAEIRAFVLLGENTKSLDGLNCKIFYGDVTKKETLTEIFDVPKNTEIFVIHCAAIVYIKTKYNQKVYDVNVTGTKNVIEKVLKLNAKLVYVSSVHALPEKKNKEIMSEIKEFDPNKVVGHYAKTKAQIANYVLEAVEKQDLNACIVHPSGIIGPNDYGNSHLTQLIIDFSKNRLTACVKGGYDFVDVRDVAEGILLALEKGKKGSCYILSNRYVEIKELLDLISEVRQKKKIKTILPIWFAKLTAPLSEMYYALLRQPPLYTKYSLYTLNSNSNFSNELAKKELGYKTRDLKETIKDTMEWLEKNERIEK